MHACERGFFQRTNTARNSNKLGHARISAGANGGAIIGEGRGSGLAAAVLVFDFELVLEHLGVDVRSVSIAGVGRIKDLRQSHARPPRTASSPQEWRRGCREGFRGG